MSIFDQLFGNDRAAPRPAAPAPAATADAQAVERYRYMLRTAPPETVEQAHAEAFAQLTPEQRRIVLDQLRGEVPESERAAVMRDGASPQALARLATRAEVRNPGAMERTFGGSAAPGIGGMVAGSLLGSIAGTVLGTMIAQHFLGANPPSAADLGGTASADDAATDNATTADAGDAFDDAGGDDFDSGDTLDV